MTKKKTRIELFLELAKPDNNWVSRWVRKTEFIWDYSDLYFENWCSWGRSDWSLAKKYIVEFDKSLTQWNRVDAIRLNWFNNDSFWTQGIRKDIWDFYSKKRCLILDTWKPEVDHKNGWKNSKRVMNKETQEFWDFQPLSKAANDAKRQHCKNCKKTWVRFDAKKLGYPISYYTWDERHIWDEDWCIWCFWFDPIAFRKKLKSTWN